MPDLRIGKSFLILSTSRGLVLDVVPARLAGLRFDGYIESIMAATCLVIPFRDRILQKQGSIHVNKVYQNLVPNIDTKAENRVSNVERVYRDVKITVLTGDITKLEVDAIVNPANSQLIMGGGVAGAILRAGGDQIQKQALRKAPVQIGSAVATTASRLKARYVIHAPTMTRPAMAATLEDIKAATRGALECARQIHVNSIAFPGLGTGVGGLDLQDAANAIAEEIKNHIEAKTTIKEITLVGYKPELAKAFEKATRLMQ